MLWVWVTLTVSSVTAHNWTTSKVAGKVCRHVGDSVWTCRLQKDCTTSVASFPKRTNHDPCKTVGPDTLECCQPEGVDLPAGTKSKERCKEYGKHVFEKVYDPYLEDFLERDRCITYELLNSYTGPVEAREYPHMAYIGVGSRNKTTWFCGASLISERFIISAAHCARYERQRVKWARIGDYNVQSLEDDLSGMANSLTLKITRHYVHKNYNDGTLYDIALFELESNVQFSEYVRPICLYTEERLPSPYGITTGWGWGLAGLHGEKSGIMQKSNVTIIPCENKPLVNKTTDDDSTICAVGLGSDSHLCKGDFGGPLQLRIIEPYCMYGLMGIFSHCVVRASSTRLVYTRVSRYTRWIESIVWPLHHTNISKQLLL